MIGKTVSHYQVIEKLGAGGMGEVYRAHDTTLDRQVAIKVLPDIFSGDPERLARFEREAKLLASLNHPNIAAIHGLEESAGKSLLVMELVEGETLAQRLAKGPLPMDEALEICRQIAEGLEAAHERNVIHRDLKPANIKITPEGKVKILDFGLAKALADETQSVNASQSPTITEAMTRPGVILGTAAYMSPEQARGRTVDKRTDVWAFGVILFELLTGRSCFPGDTVTDVLAAVVKSAPDWAILPEDTPPVIRMLLKQCLQKDRNLRLHDIGDARIEMSEELAEPSTAVSITRPATRWSFWLGWGVASLLLVALAILGFAYFNKTEQMPQITRFEIQPPGTSPAQFLALSPDGRYLAFVASDAGLNQVWIRAMDALESRALAGTDGATYPFWSPDGTYLGFFAQGKLKKIAIAGGPPLTLCEAASGRGATWNRDGVIVFSAGPASPIFRVPAAGGVPKPITVLHKSDPNSGHRFPSFLPDGVHFLYDAGSDKPDERGLFVGSLSSNVAIRLLPDDTNALYAPATSQGGAGFLLFRRQNILMAQPFDPKALKTVGEMSPIAEDVPNSTHIGFGAFSVSDSGVLAYRSGSSATNRELVWMDRSGKRLGAVGKTGTFSGFAVSPDEKRVAVRINGIGQSDLWLQDMEQDISSRFTFRSGIHSNPVWSPDGNQLAFTLSSLDTYSSDIYIKPTTGNGPEELILRPGVNGYALDWSPDRKWIVLQQMGRETGIDLWLMPLEGDRKPIPYLQTASNEQSAKFSPGKESTTLWMAYQSDESEQPQIYVQAVPRTGAKWQVSSSGGTSPQWCRDGKELYYVSADKKLIAVPTKLGSTVELGTPQPLGAVPAFATAYAPSHDGQRFLVNLPAGSEAGRIPAVTVITNWQAELKK